MYTHIYVYIYIYLYVNTYMYLYMYRYTYTKVYNSYTNITSGVCRCLEEGVWRGLFPFRNPAKIITTSRSWYYCNGPASVGGAFIMFPALFEFSKSATQMSKDARMHFRRAMYSC